MGKAEPIKFTVKVEDAPKQEPQRFVALVTREATEPRQITVKTEPAGQSAPTIAEPPRAFYTIPQLAELLQVHENTIYRLVRAGKIEHYKVGAQIRISAAELERLKVERKA